MLFLTCFSARFAQHSPCSKKKLFLVLVFSKKLPVVILSFLIATFHFILPVLTFLLFIGNVH